MTKVDKRFMFDTSALNHIVRSSEDEMFIYASKSKGFEYYFTEIQVNEAMDNISKHTDGIPRDLVERSRATFALKMMKVIIKLETTYVGQIATLRHYRWILDGTFTILPDDESIAWDVFQDILKNNDAKYYNDAMIGMTAIVNGCTIVTADNRFAKRVKSRLPDRAITYDDFMNIIH